MKTFITVLALVVSLAGCAIEPKQFVGPNGKTAYTMDCSGVERGIDKCYKKAGEICPSGYQIVGTPSQVTGIPVQGGMMMATHHGLVVECK